MKRRNFLHNLAIGTFTATISTLGLTAFSCQNIWNKIEKYLPVGLQAFQAIVQILIGQGVISTPMASDIAVVTADVNSAFGDAGVAVNAYQSAPAASKQSLVSEATLALTNIENAINAFWSQIKIQDPKLEAKIEGLLGLIVTSISAMLAQLPPVPATARKATSRQIKAAGSLKVTSVKEFRSQFNGLLAPDLVKYRI